MFDQEAGAAYYYSASSATFLSFDDVSSTSHKANYIVNKSLEGAFFWKIDGDATDDTSLVVVVRDSSVLFLKLTRSRLTRFSTILVLVL